MSVSSLAMAMATSCSGRGNCEALKVKSGGTAEFCGDRIIVCVSGDLLELVHLPPNHITRKVLAKVFLMDGLRATTRVLTVEVANLVDECFQDVVCSAAVAVAEERRLRQLSRFCGCQQSAAIYTELREMATALRQSICERFEMEAQRFQATVGVFLTPSPDRVTALQAAYYGDDDDTAAEDDALNFVGSQAFYADV